MRQSKFQIEHIDLTFRVYEKLKSMIQNNDLKSGQKIVQEKIAQDLGISRTPLVKALQMLENELLVQSFPRRGMIVRDMSLREIRDMFHCREGIEGIAARLAAENITGDEIDELKTIFSNFSKYNKNINLEEYKIADQKLHRKIIEISANPIFKRLEMLNNIQNITYQKGLIRSTSETMQEHLRIIDSLERKDAVAAELNMKLHYKNLGGTMKICFENKVALITGASTGIGAATAKEFGKSGAKVVVNYNSSKDAANAVVEEITSSVGEAIAVQADVTKKVEVDKLVKEALNKFGTLDILVNNTGGLVGRSTFSEMTENLWNNVLELNMTTVFLVTHAVLPIMKRKKYGRIINVASIAGRNGGGPGAGHYSATKAALIALTKNLAKEVINDGILVNAVNPGVITTPFHDKFTTPAVRENFKKIIPLSREGTPEEIAWPILFLASDYASYIVGEAIEINGGMLMD
jgi:3-oxoacyl-[acyl-carrier protein] reductase